MRIALLSVDIAGLISEATSRDIMDRTVLRLLQQRPKSHSLRGLADIHYPIPLVLCGEVNLGKTCYTRGELVTRI